MPEVYQDAIVHVSNQGSAAATPAIQAGCEVYNNAAETVGAGLTVTLTFNSEVFVSPASMHSTSAAIDPATGLVTNSELVIPTTGLWLITARVAWLANGNTALLQLQIENNSATLGLLELISAQTFPDAANDLYQQVAVMRHLGVGDKLSVRAVNGGAAARTIEERSDFTGSETQSPYFTAARLV